VPEHCKKKLGMFAVLLLLPLVAGCGTWQDNAAKALLAVHTVAKEASARAEPAYRAKCGKVAKACSGLPCTALEVCQLERRKVNAAIKGIHLSVQALAKALPLIEQARGGK
jgi:hypothetical protein